MKKNYLLIVVFIVSVCVQKLYSDAVGMPESGYINTGHFTLNGKNDYEGSVVFYYDKDRMSMAIRIKVPPASAGMVYCYENDNPKLYNMMMTCIMKHLDGITGYSLIAIWYKVENGKNILQGFGFKSS